MKVLVIAGQHGDERSCRKAVAKLSDHLIGSETKSQSAIMQVAILQDANPDGFKNKTRTNAKGIDLNRDHLLLRSAETRAIHNFVRKWQPQVVIDVHNYPSKRKHLLTKDLILCQDVFIDVPTNPTISALLASSKCISLLDTVKSELQSRGFSCERYCLPKKSGRIRNSTPDIIDARNFLSLRYNTLGVLVEGRTPTRKDNEQDRSRLIDAQISAIISVLNWSAQNGNYLFRIKQLSSDGVPIHSRYINSGQSISMNFRNAKTDKIEQVTLSGRYTPSLVVTKNTTLAEAYAVPSDKSSVIDLLHRHGFVSSQANALPQKVVTYFVDSVLHSKRKDRAPRKVLVLNRNESIKLSGYRIFPVSKKGGVALTILLEPESKYGLHRYDEMELTPISKTLYPILRISKVQAPMLP